MSDFIPQELLVDIFSRLPVKSLIRFMSLSKLWRSVISSPDFIDIHLTKSSKKPTFMLSRFSRDESQIEHFNLSSHDGTVGQANLFWLDCTLKSQSQLQFVGACNGLFCLSDYWVADKQKLTLWNPSIRRYVHLPSPRFTVDNHMCYIWFGFDLKTNDFKVGRLVYFSRGKETKRFPLPMLEVYALTSGCWKPVSTAAPPPFGVLLCKGEQIYINGACIRLGFKRSADNARHIVLWSFDLGEEVFQMIDTPEMVLHGASNQGFGVRLFRGMVSVFCVRDVEIHCSLSIWVMREYGVVDSWTKQYKFDFGGCVSRPMREEFHACCYVESLALISGSSRVLQAPVLRGEFSLPVWLTKGGEGEGDEEDIIIKEAANKNFRYSVISVAGNILDFLLTS